MRRSWTQRRSPRPGARGFAAHAAAGGHRGKASPRRALKSRARARDACVAVFSGSGSTARTRSASAAARQAARKNATMVAQATGSKTASTLPRSISQPGGNVQYELSEPISETPMLAGNSSWRRGQAVGRRGAPAAPAAPCGSWAASRIARSGCVSAASRRRRRDPGPRRPAPGPATRRARTRPRCH